MRVYREGIACARVQRETTPPAVSRGHLLQCFRCYARSFRAKSSRSSRAKVHESNFGQASCTVEEAGGGGGEKGSKSSRKGEERAGVLSWVCYSVVGGDGRAGYSVCLFGFATQ